MTKASRFIEVGAAFCKTHGEHSDFCVINARSRPKLDGSFPQSIKCNICSRATCKSWRARNKDKVRELNKSWATRFPLRKVLHNAFNHAKEYQREFSLTEEYMQSVLEKQNYRCALTNIPFDNADNKMSIDRIDSSKDYVPENVWLVTKAVNVMKRDLTVQKFISCCQLVALKHGS